MGSAYCEPCNALSKKMEANYWCMDCQERLCNECTKIHKVQKMSKSHHVIPLTAKPEIFDMQNSCIKHEFSFEYFCVDHYKLCCRECIALSHRICQNVHALEVAAMNAKDSQSYMDTFQQTEHTLKAFTSLIENRESSIKNLKMSAKIIKDKITGIKKGMINRIDQLEEKLISKLNFTKETQVAEIQSKIDTIKEVVSKTQESKEQFKFIKQYGSDKQAFIFTQIAQQYLQEAVRKVQNLVRVSKDSCLTFSACTDIESITIGSIDKKEKLCEFEFAPLKHFIFEIPVKEQSKCETFTYLKDIQDIPDKIITGMTVTHNNLLILCDVHNSALHVYGQNEMFMRSIQLKDQPWGVATIPKTTTAVVSGRYKPFIQFVDVSFGRIERNVIVPGGSSFSGISVTFDHILVGSTNEIHVLNHSGKHVKTIQLQAKQHIWYMTTITNGAIVFTCPSKNEFYGVSNDGHGVFTYKSENMKHPRNRICDHSSNLYVVAKDTQNIHKLTSDGKELKTIILSQTNKLKKPCAICFNNDCSKLFVSNKDGSIISVFDVA